VDLNVNWQLPPHDISDLLNGGTIDATQATAQQTGYVVVKCGVFWCTGTIIAQHFLIGNRCFKKYGLK
jgi:hypothetical protein